MGLIVFDGGRTGPEGAGAGGKKVPPYLDRMRGAQGHVQEVVRIRAKGHISDNGEGQGAAAREHDIAGSCRVADGERADRTPNVHEEGAAVSNRDGISRA